MPALIAVAHGTRSPAGQAQIRDLVARVAARRPGLDVRLSYVDVQEPKIAEVARLVPDAVVVPLLLSAGYHVRVDIAEAVAGAPILVTKPLGPDDVLLDSMLRHLPPADAVVLAAAGSSDPAWRADVERLAVRLAGSLKIDSPVSHRLPRPPGVGVGGGDNPTQRRSIRAELSTGVRVGYVSGPGPRVPEVVAELRAQGARRVAIAAYFLADGLFYRGLRQSGADDITPPLCLDPAVTDLVLRRYEAALLTTADGRL
ncbi:sirohydrochlorin chelatase [Actinoplanes sp. Pm04-4]|uniref:Sirohydrochlorin chelatase n=1 Tax=Paractinoplanes pyxinae TaxID=2997416 RepID=A0ABT4B341_9ACTN|nr:CbiX/SirB N-terminal domain-containing protein [Actinoplanes pyxinae]MCY1140912.1 sirohydrochlorin chelatase [Actinoplanes pyxinae]